VRIYEGMFVVPSGKAKEDFSKVTEHLREIIEKAGGRMINCVRWEDRKLAYEIAKQRRAVYVLSHFEAPAESISRIEQRCRLSETVLRALIVRDEDGIEVPRREEDSRRDSRRSRRWSGRKDGGAPAPAGGGETKTSTAKSKVEGQEAGRAPAAGKEAKEGKAGSAPADGKEAKEGETGSAPAEESSGAPEVPGAEEATG